MTWPSKAQGFLLSDCPYIEAGVSTRQVGLMVGNAVAVNVIGCVLQEALWSAGLLMERRIFPINLKA